MSAPRPPRLAAAAALAVLALLGGCATTGTPGAGGQAEAAANPRDPWEGFNRKVFAFNDALDRAVLVPVATAYRDGVPELVRRGVDNFFGNFADAWSALNQLLQAKPFEGANMAMRVFTNTLFGLGGVLDPATEMGLERQSEDFGQTLAVWGLPSGPYLVLPVFGPSSVREGFALPVDRYVTPESLLVERDSARFLLGGLDVVNTRAGLLGASRMLDDVALDRYSFLRDAYLARRRSLQYDGEPPEEAEPAEPPPAAPR